MSTALQNNGLKELKVPNASSFRIGLVVAEWNREITLAMEEGAMKILNMAGLKSENLYRLWVPGSFELISGTQMLLENKTVDGVICLGCVIQGETPHFDFICHSVSMALAQLTIQYTKPVIFGVLTTFTLEQAIDRSGGKHGNKGEEGALTALKMVEMKKNLVKNTLVAH